MKSNFSIVVWMMVVSILLKLIVFAGNYQYTSVEQFSIFGNIFVLLTGVFLGIQQFKNRVQTKTSFLQDVKAGMRVAALYAIFITLFVYLYYSFIDNTYFSVKLSNQIQLLEQSEEGSAANIKKAKELGAFILSPFFHSTVTLIGFLILGSFYAAIITFLVRKYRHER